MTGSSSNLVLVNAKEDCPDTLKALWASKLYNVPLTLGKKDSSTEKGVALICNYNNDEDDSMTLYDGNSMAQAIRLLGKASTTTMMEDMIVEDWCEWESTSMDVTKNNSKLLTALEEKKDYLVGNTTTIADICVVVNLSSTVVSLLPASLGGYLETHRAALDNAKAYHNDLSPKPADATDPCAIRVVKSIFEQTIKNLFGHDVQLPQKSWLVRSSVPKDGDYQCSAAMAIFASLRKSGTLPSTMKKPQDIAHAIVAEIGDSHPIVMDFAVNGPGFVLCRLTPSYLQYHLDKFLRSGKLPKPVTVPSTCVVDFSSPNIAKEMHVGHLRSTIIGESVCRILEYAGNKVHRVNHVGDWGTQFGMLIQYLREEYPDFADSMPNISDLTVFYKNAKARFDENADFKKTAQLNVVKLQSGDEECRKIWNILCDVSRLEFQKVYDRLDINVQECGESFYNSKIPPVIEEFRKANLLSEQEGGAKLIFIDGFPSPLMVQKSDGGFGYDSTDMAALKYRLQTLNAKRIIVITDKTQENHFKMCFKAADMIGWIDDNQRLEHIGFGTVNDESGQRYKTRSGKTERLVDLLDEAVNRMKASLQQRLATGMTSGISEDDIPKVAEAIGYGSVKYFDLQRNPSTDYKFSYDRMLSTNGNTAVYLLFAHARLESIMAKAKEKHNIDVDELLSSLSENTEAVVQLGHPSERNLALHLQLFSETILATLEDLYPFRICEFVYNLSNAVSEFVNKCYVLDSPEMKSRLLLCKATTLAMRECFALVGIPHVNRI